MLSPLRLINEKGGPRARYILLHMLDKQRREASPSCRVHYPYVNTIPVEQGTLFPGDEAHIERRYAGGSAETRPSK